MRDPRGRSRGVHTSPASLLEALEPRLHLSVFAYTSLTQHLAEATPLFTLRPAGENAPPPTIASSVANAGDVDGDGVNDILVGSGGRNSSGSDPIRALAAVYSGATGQPLLTVNDGFTEFGAAVAGIGDVNADGVPDFLVGSPRWDADGDGGGGPDLETGRAYIYSGADGAVLHTFTGEAEGDRFGEAVAAAGDVDGDGVADVIIGAPRAAGGGDARGAAYIFSGDDGSLILAINGTVDRARFGAAVAGAGDLDGDGDAEVIVGAPGAAAGDIQAPGNAYVFDVNEEEVLFALAGSENRDEFGFAVAGGGDVDDDGVPDLIVGAPSFDATDTDTIPGAGRAVVYSGADGSVLLTFTGERPNGNLGAAVAFAGDVNLDGHDDLLIGSPSANPEASVVVYSGDGGGVLHAFVARTSNLVGSDRLGTAAAALGDITGDGIVDFVFAGTQDANAGRNDRSRMYVFSGAPAAALQPRGINDDHAIWGDTGVAGADFLILNGELFIVHARDGFMPGDQVIDVSNSDVVLGARTNDGSEPFLWEGGVRTALEDLIVTFDGPMGDYTGLRAVDITDEGLVLVERLLDGATPTTWVLDDGTLRYLFDGTPVRLNASGAAVGIAAGTSDDTVYWTAADGALVIADFEAVDLNDGGVILGIAPAEGMPGVFIAATWAGGTISPLGTIDGGDNYEPTAINNDGRAVGAYEAAGGGIAAFYFDPEDGMSDITPLVIDPPAELTTSVRLILADINNDGVIVGAATDLGAGFVLTPAADAITGERDGEIDAEIPADGGQAVVTLNAAGDIIVYSRDPATGEWSAINLTEEAGSPRATEVASFTDSATGLVYYVALTDEGVYMIHKPGPGSDLSWDSDHLTERAEGAVPIVRGLTILQPAGNRVIITGVDADGDVVAYTLTFEVSPEGLTRLDVQFQDISDAHLRPNNFQSPVFEGRLVSFVTAWNSLHLTGLDEDGRIWAVWTAPELGGRWESVNLSEITGAPAIVGGLAPFLTPWGTIHIAGADENGDTVVTWWAPGFGGRWEKNNLTEEFSFSKLRPESVSSFVTPWGGLNIAGLDDRGEVRVYWWSPESNTWQIDGIDVERPDRAARPMRRLDGFSGRDESMNLYGVGPGGEILRLFWHPGQSWRFENLTEAARA